jgi:hypothetical protein
MEPQQEAAAVPTIWRGSEMNAPIVNNTFISFLYLLVAGLSGFY